MKYQHCYNDHMMRPILLVEDAPNDIELALYALKKCGVPNDIIVARDGEQALDYLLYRGTYQSRVPVNPGLVLLDLKLPKLDGIQVLGAIRSNPTLAEIAVVVLTASAMEADVNQTMALGIEAYVVKPMEVQRFVSIMCDVFGGSCTHASSGRPFQHIAS
ncbi:MAG: response regulator [Oxalobacteraceae bacterium]|nr:MAG: response regulator [Oxalobacteraceae bacterium]